MTILSELLDRKSHVTQRPVVVCLCGALLSSDAFQHAGLPAQLQGKIAVSANSSGLDLGSLHAIDMADEVLFLNQHGYMSVSMLRELEYAQLLGKPIRWLEPQMAPKDLLV